MTPVPAPGPGLLAGKTVLITGISGKAGVIQSAEGAGLGGVVEVEAAGGVTGVFGCAGQSAVGKDGLFVSVFAGQGRWPSRLDLNSRRTYGRDH